MQLRFSGNALRNRIAALLGTVFFLLSLFGCAQEKQLTAANVPQFTIPPIAGSTAAAELTPSPRRTETLQKGKLYLHTRMYITADGARFFAGNTEDFENKILCSLKRGASVRLIESGDMWTYCSYNNILGYVLTVFLCEDEPEELVEYADRTVVLPSIVVHKSLRILELYDNDELFCTVPVSLGFDPVGNKSEEGDGKTPEGDYYVCFRNPYSASYLSLGVSYPSVSDARRGMRSGLITYDEFKEIKTANEKHERPLWHTALGGQIMIHGNGGFSDTTDGCVAVANEVMDLLWECCDLNTPITILP